jgi:hypothetical protein
MVELGDPALVRTAEEVGGRLAHRLVWTDQEATAPGPVLLDRVKED